ncbi:hypothetical protein ACFSX9_15430 [Flavobacterium ardleyense]|uniref:Uncharacterized protein n=1 Tax=Flavobacterium ardleyense TaxID=2038737 RepID=A0ABW5ZCC3_9FLAO
MIENIAIPDVLKQEAGNEKIEFFVKAKKVQPTRDSVSLIGSGIFWIVVVCLIFSGFVWELFYGDCTTVSIGGDLIEVCRDDLSPLNLLFIYFSFFIAPGILFFFLGVFALFSSGGYYLGTKDNLICYSRGKIKPHPWESFTNDIEMFGSEKHGNIIFKLKTGVHISRNGKKILSNSKIKIADILYAGEIERYCHNRIAKIEGTETPN